MGRAVGLCCGLIACTPSPAPAPPPLPTSAPSVSAVVAVPPASEASGWRSSAARYLDQSAQRWLDRPPNTGANQACAVCCHTTHTYALARAELGASPVVDRLAGEVAQRVSAAPTWRDVTPMYGKPGSDKERESDGSEAVLNASLLAFLGADEPAMTGAWANLWEVQRDDGSWDWLDFELQPFEADNHDWGASVAALAVGLTGHADGGRAALADYLRGRLGAGMRLHAQAVLLWAATAWQGLLTETQQTAIAQRLAAARQGSGWSLTQLGFEDARLAAPGEVDGYATALVTFALCTARREPASYEEGVRWLQANQRADGSWPGRSLNSNSPRAADFMSDSATAYAVLALARCGPSRLNR